MKHRLIKVWFVMILFILAVTFIELPYYVTSPGMAKELAPIVHVKGGFLNEEGSLMLTTIKVSKANMVEYTWAKWSDYQYLFKEEEMRPQDQSDEEYNTRQLRMMDTSKESAAYVAYKYAGKKIEIKEKGVYVVDVIPNMPASGKLKSGDRIASIDGQVIKNAEQLIQYITSKLEGDLVVLQIDRKGGTTEEQIPLSTFPGDEKKVGLGIQLETDSEVVVEPSLEIDTSDIGGPSAGLMFSLEVYNQLVQKDITNGLQIAGTGTIDFEGKVGRIGGIKQKIVAANNAGAQLFFAPNENGKKDSNYMEAKAAGKDIGTEMKIVPVDSFTDAIQYLEKVQTD